MNLVLNMQAGLTEFVRKAGADGALENPGSESGVHAQRALDHSVTRVVWTQKEPTLCVLRVHCGEYTLKQVRGRA